MTTAHRPTWNSVVASGTNPSGNLIVAQSRKVANRDAASFLSLKERQAGQGTRDERPSRKELMQDLEKKEKKAKDEREGKVQDKKDEPRGYDKAKKIEDNPFPEDADEEVPSEPEKEEEEDEEDDDEDTEELMRELAKIKKEREAEAEALKATQAKQDERARRDEIMMGNPLVAATDTSLKRKWDDETVFKNQAKLIPKQKQRYINDAVRSDFHKKFLNKYVWVDGTAH